MNTGVLVDWNDERGFGFIEQDGARLFVHVSAFDAAGGRPRTGDMVSFEVGMAADGRRRAVRASREVARRSTPRLPMMHLQPLPIGVTAVLMVLLVSAIWTGWMLSWLGATYLVMSLFTAVLYAVDKRRAVAGSWRVPEANLQVAALLGGWPGAVLAQQLLRHKSRKRSFQVAFWVCVAVNLLLFSLISHPDWLAPVTDALP